jgi:hypothetical protein
MAEANASKQYPNQPRKGRHLYAVARFDGLREGSDPIESFVLTRGYWDEGEAKAQAEKLNNSTPGTDTRYFVLPVRVADKPNFAKPS